jgi:hypothetical protein
VAIDLQKNNIRPIMHIFLQFQERCINTVYSYAALTGTDPNLTVLLFIKYRTIPTTIQVFIIHKAFQGKP